MSFLHIIDSWCISTYENLFIPVVTLTDASLRLIFLPARQLPPHLQILIVALVGVLLSRTLTRFFRNRREWTLKQAFESRLSSLRETRTIEDRQLQTVIKKGIQTEADEIYNQILLDKFIENGISYFFPLLFFLIWLQYSLFSPEALEALTGQPYVWITNKGIKLSASMLYIYAFNGFLVLLFLIRVLIYGFRNRRSILNRLFFRKNRQPLINYPQVRPAFEEQSRGSKTPV